MTHRDRLFEAYHETHARHVDRGNDKTAWFAEHVRLNYLPLLPEPATKPAILEVGCSTGAMLAALHGRGYDRLTGIDLSEPDLEIARRDVPGAELHLADALRFLRDQRAAYDVVIAKAVLEHQEKAAVLPFLEAIRGSLRPGGTVLIEVPNMDWLLAQHERYMDFTHEVGFTRESLAQVLRLTFGSAQVYPVAESDPLGPFARVRRRAVRALARTAMSMILRGLGHSGHEMLWHARSILGVARAPIEEGR